MSSLNPEIVEIKGLVWQPILSSKVAGFNAPIGGWVFKHPLTLENGSFEQSGIIETKLQPRGINAASFAETAGHNEYVQTIVL